jgi:hypothetical protein
MTLLAHFNMVRRRKTSVASGGKEPTWKWLRKATIMMRARDKERTMT